MISMIPQFYTFLRYTSSRKLESTIHTQSTSMEQRSWNDQKLLTTLYAFAYADKPAAENTEKLHPRVPRFSRFIFDERTLYLLSTLWRWL